MKTYLGQFKKVLNEFNMWDFYYTCSLHIVVIWRVELQSSANTGNVKKRKCVQPCKSSPSVAGNEGNTEKRRIQTVHSFVETPGIMNGPK